MRGGKREDQTTLATAQAEAMPVPELRIGPASVHRLSEGPSGLRVLWSAPMTGKLASYAQTGVTPGRSHEQIERLLQRIGVDAFRWTSEGEREGLEFRWPRVDSSPAAFRLIIYFNSDRQRAQLLRALYWYLKAKVEAIEFGLVDIEQEFFPQMLVPGGQTVYEAVKDDGLARLISPDTIALPEGRPDASS